MSQPSNDSLARSMASLRPGSDPAEFMPPSKFRVDCAVYGEHNWATNALRFDTALEAEEYARNLHGRWTMLRGWRIVPESTPDRQPINEDEVQS